MSRDEDTDNYCDFLKQQSAIAPPLIPNAEDPDEDDADDIDDEAIVAKTLEAKPRHRHPRSSANDAAQAYVDKVVAEAIGHGVKAMGSHLESVKKCIAEAKSPEELKASLKRLARDIKRGSLEETVTNARLMANMAGRASEANR